ncbi:autotransporter domain-containing protein [Sagittula sp.]|uniref:autotransporter domain-containing protein n=1 Tax=Sagittula sp. TaxID=2038081 RepID=UPI004058F83E
MRHLRRISACAAAFLSIGAMNAGAALAGCNNEFFSVDYNYGGSQSYGFPGDLKSGEDANFTAAGDFQFFKIELNGKVLCNSAASCNGYTYTAPATDSYYFLATGQSGPGTGKSGTATYSCTAATTGPGTGGGTANSATATGGGLPAAAQGAGSTVAAAGSTAAVGNAINNAITGTGPNLSTQGLFLSGGGTSSPLQAWASLQGRNYSGDIDGRSFEFTLGADMEVAAGTRLGLFLSSGRADLDVAGIDVETDALSFGPYFKTRLSDTYEVTGYALFARPDYEVGGTSYEAERRAAGLTANANYMWGNTEIESFLGVSGFSEDHPSAGALSSRTVSALTGSIGTKAIFGQGAPLRPYVSIGADFNRYDDGVNRRTTHNTPRLGTGFTYHTGSGSLSMDLNGGQIFEDTRDVELRMNYNFNF